MKPMMNIAVVTSCHNYGRYLADWARSIITLTRWPSVVALVDNGSTDTTWAQTEEAAAILRKAGLPEVRTKRIPFTDFGTARNEAVALGGDAEWIMHMDADDMFMPHCLDDVYALAPKADVVALGYERCGDLASGPRNRTRVYTGSRGKQTLQSQAPASGVSPFRRTLWEHIPYRNDMIGGWDTALWIGFAHLNARFVASKRPCFYYRQHADSIFNQRRNHRRRGRIVGAKLTSLRRARHGVSILVPRRGDGGGPRDKAWEWVRAHYAAIYPDWEVVDGNQAPSGPWRKGVAATEAFSRSRGRTLIIADSDCVLPKEALRKAVELVETGKAPWVVPHTLVKRLDQKSSASVLAHKDPKVAEPPFPGSMDRTPYAGYAGGGFIIIDAARWDAVGGIPRSFAGWGAEDEATAVILDTLVGPHVRLEYDLWHLWHPHARRSGGQTHHTQNRSLFNLIRSLSGNEDGLFELLEKLDAGAPVADVIASRGAGLQNAVPMMALMDFKRGTELIRKGFTFMATMEEARRHESRPRRIAVRANGRIASAISPVERTLELRSEQYLKNQAAKLTSAKVAGPTP